MFRLRTSFSLRQLAAVILPLFVLGLFLDSQHQAAFQHEVCPVDGELTHATESHQHDAEHGTHEDKGEHEDSEEEEHEHCGLPTLGVESEAPAVEFALFLAHAESPAPVSSVRELERHSERLFLLAPKNSPPARS